MSQTIDVFVSYKREERALAETLIHALVAAGYVAVYDLNIAKNDDFGEAIDTMIRKARMTIVLWTEAAAKSEWVRKEAKLALKLDRDDGFKNHYLSVLVEDVDILLPFALQDRQGIAAYPEGLTAAKLDEILVHVRETIGTKPKAEVALAAPVAKVLSEELQLYEWAESIEKIEGYKRYLELYPKGQFAEVAKREIKRLSGLFGGWKLSHKLTFLGIIVAAAVGLFGIYMQQAPTTVAGIPQEAYDAVVDEVSTLRRDHQTELENVLQQVGSLESQNGDLIRDLDTARRNLDAASGTEERLAELQQKIETLEMQNGDLIRSLQAAEQAAEMARSRIAELERELDQTQVQDSVVPEPDCISSDGKPGYQLWEGQRYCFSVDERTVVLSDTDVADLSKLRGMKSLTRLFVDNTSVPDLESLRGLTNLTELWAHNSQVSDLEPLRSLKNLTRLSVDNTSVSDLGPLRELRNLTELWVHNSSVSDLEPLRGLTNLTELWVKNTGVFDLEPLRGLAKLAYLVDPVGQGHSGRQAVQAAIESYQP